MWPDDLGFLQVGQGQAAGPEDGVVGVVERPVLERDPLLLRHLLEKLASGKRREDEELRRRQARFPGPVDGFPERPPVVLVEPEDEHAVDVNPVAAEDADGPVELGHGLGFVRFLEAFGIHRLETDADGVTPRLFHQTDELRVAGDVGPDLGRPAELESFPDHGLEQLAGSRLVGGEIVVVEEEDIVPAPV